MVSWFRVAADPRSSERNQILELRSGSVKVKRNRKLGGGCQTQKYCSRRKLLLLELPQIINI